jgi:hypothetical protein
MRHKIWTKELVFGIILLLAVTSIASPAFSITNHTINHISFNDARVEILDGVKILYVNGSYYEMGYQHGFLLKEEGHENMRAFLSYINEISSYETMLDIWNTTQPYVPCCYIEEMQGLSDGAQIPFETIAACYMLILFMDMQCFTYAAWKNATTDGELYHFRSLDFPLRIKDPLSGKYIQENSVLIVRKPKNGLKSLTPSIAGGINFYQGVNEKQISIGVEVCWSSDETLLGIPAKFKTQRVLDTAQNIKEAVDILTTNNTLGWNFIVSDGKEKTGYAIEITANLSYNGTWDNPVERNQPFWHIKEVVRRTNFFIHPQLASTQRQNYDPSGLKGFFALFKGEPFFLLWRKYTSMSKEIQKNHGEINLESGMSLMRKVYTGRTDIIMFLSVRFHKQSILCDFQQWGVCPTTGDFVISFSDANTYAHEAELHYFKLSDLFN